MSLSDLEKLQKIQHTLVFEDGLYATDVEDVANGEGDLSFKEVAFRLNHAKELEMIEELINDCVDEIPETDEYEDENDEDLLDDEELMDLFRKSSTIDESDKVVPKKSIKVILKGNCLELTPNCKIGIADEVIFVEAFIPKEKVVGFDCYEEVEE